MLIVAAAAVTAAVFAADSVSSSDGAAAAAAGSHGRPARGVTGSVWAPPAKQMSAGLFGADGRLLRTLWSGRSAPAAGEVEVWWDGELDEHVDPSACDSPGCEIRLIASNVTYTWEGLIGNTGPSTGPNILRSGGTGPTSLALAGNFGFVTLGYNEGQTGMKMFLASNPHQWIDIAHPDRLTVFNHVATDGERAYFASSGAYSCCENFTFTVALDLKVPGMCEHNFTKGGRALPDDWHGAGGSASHCGDGKDCRTKSPDMQNAPNHGANDGYDGCNSFGGYWSSVADFDYDNTTAQDEQNQTVSASIVTGMAVQYDQNGVSAADQHLLFIAHGYKNEVRALNKHTGEVIAHLHVDHPGKLATAVSPSPRLWAITGAAGEKRVQRFGVTSGPAVGLQWQQNLSGVIDPLDICTTPDGKLLAVADGANSQVKVFDANSLELLHTIGQAGGYSDGDPTVATDKFLWKPSEQAVALACGSCGSVSCGEHGCQCDGPTIMVTDNGNRRIVTFNATSGAVIGKPVMYIPASYVSTVVETNPRRVFAGFLEFEVDYDGTGKTPLSDQWRLVRNWEAGVDPSLRFRPPVWDGFHAVAELDTAVSQNAGRNITLGYLTRSQELGGAALVELVAGKGLRLLRNISTDEFPQYPAPNVMLAPDGALRYQNTTCNLSSAQECPNSNMTVVQSVYSAKFDPGSMSHLLPGTLLASVTTRGDKLAARFSIPGARYPITASDKLVFFDAGTGKARPGSGELTNQGYHLGAVQLSEGETAKAWAWQASPWGTWELTESAPQLLGEKLIHTMGPNGAEFFYKGYNISQYEITAQTMDGRFGANDTAINYAGSYAMASGDQIVYGFHGEFWKNGEANQFVHFRDDGTFVGQFGAVNMPYKSNQYAVGHQGTDGLTTWGLPGHAGNSFSPSLVQSDGALWLIHNDENAHGGLHRWRIEGTQNTHHILVRAV